MHMRLPSLRVCRYTAERRSISKDRTGVAAAADLAYGIQSNPFLPSVWRMFPICISVWTPLSSMTVFMPPAPGMTVLTSPAVEVLLANYEPK